MADQQKVLVLVTIEAGIGAFYYHWIIEGLRAHLTLANTRVSKVVTNRALSTIRFYTCGDQYDKGLRTPQPFARDATPLLILSINVSTFSRLPLTGTKQCVYTAVLFPNRSCQTSGGVIKMNFHEKILASFVLGFGSLGFTNGRCHSSPYDMGTLETNFRVCAKKEWGRKARSA